MLLVSWRAPIDAARPTEILGLPSPFPKPRLRPQASPQVQIVVMLLRALRPFLGRRRHHRVAKHDAASRRVGCAQAQEGFARSLAWACLAFPGSSSECNDNTTVPAQRPRKIGTRRPPPIPPSAGMMLSKCLPRSLLHRENIYKDVPFQSSARSWLENAGRRAEEGDQRSRCCRGRVFRVFVEPEAGN